MQNKKAEHQKRNYCQGRPGTLCPFTYKRILYWSAELLRLSSREKSPPHPEKRKKEEKQDFLPMKVSISSWNMRWLLQLIKILLPKSLYSTKKSISSYLSYLIRRGQDSNLQSSGHEPDESTNSSTPLLPLIFLSLFPPGFPLLAWPG